MQTITDLDWNRADVTIGGEVHSRIGFRLSDGTATARARNGTPMATLEVVESETVDAKTFRFTGEDGTVWTVKRRGCNCGN